MNPRLYKPQHRFDLILQNQIQNVHLRTEYFEKKFTLYSKKKKNDYNSERKILNFPISRWKTDRLQKLNVRERALSLIKVAN